MLPRLVIPDHSISMQYIRLTPFVCAYKQIHLGTSTHCLRGFTSHRVVLKPSILFISRISTSQWPSKSLSDRSKQHKIPILPIFTHSQLLSPLRQQPNLPQNLRTTLIPTIRVRIDSNNPGKSIPRPGQKCRSHHRRDAFTPVVLAKPVPKGHDVRVGRVPLETDDANGLV